jgi:hypothetical protein
MGLAEDKLIIDLDFISPYNTAMIYICRYFAGFFRPDHDPPLVW